MEAMQQLDRSLADSLRTKAIELERPLSEKQKKQIDSLWTIQTQIDSLNTLQLIATIETAFCNHQFCTIS